ncbi:cyclic nucleotide-binding domain-containing protein [Paenibacillus sp. P26]|nr:cyclic nucleotide-binding domain-containing protein [Paenibacillus sp. P26]UUZ95334.1 cyclic nucleotide-binding domain-containing protein [Paenibacillus sp. P25]
MKIMEDQELIKHYLQVHNIENTFPEAMIPYFSLHRFHPGELICSQGEAAHHMYVQVKGKVKVYTTSSLGKTLVLSFKNPLEVIGEIEYLRGISFLNTVEAVSSVDMITIHHRRLDQYGKAYPPLLQFLLDIISRKFCLKSDFLTFNLLYPVEIRLASYLMSVSMDETNSCTNKQISAEHLRDAANLIGTSPRHLNRIIRQFCEKGLMVRSKDGIAIRDWEKLESLVSHNIYE